VNGSKGLNRPKSKHKVLEPAVVESHTTPGTAKGRYRIFGAGLYQQFAPLGLALAVNGLL